MVLDIEKWRLQSECGWKGALHSTVAKLMIIIHMTKKNGTIMTEAWAVGSQAGLSARQRDVGPSYTSPESRSRTFHSP